MLRIPLKMIITTGTPHFWTTLVGSKIPQHENHSYYIWIAVWNTPIPPPIFNSLRWLSNSKIAIKYEPMFTNIETQVEWTEGYW